jgi:RHS repeat-associated protein
MWRRTEDTIHEYDYNDKNELIYDDEEIRCVYDEDGRLIQLENTSFEYDEENRLTGSISDKYLTAYTYDEWGGRSSRTVNGVTEYYVPFRGNDLMVLDERGSPKEVCIPGFSPHPNTLRPIAIETEETIYAPIHDIQGNIVKLVDIFSREVICLEKPDPFARGLSKNAPVSCIFAGKHYDKEEGLIYFGDRYYSPKIRRWLTPDPEYQTADPYQYCFNNPLSYCDPDGRFVIVIPLVFGAITASEILTGAAIATATAWAGYELCKRADQLSDACQHWIDNKTRSKDLYPEYEIHYRHFSPSTTNYYDDGIFVTTMERNKKEEIDPRLPVDPEWENIGHSKKTENENYKTYESAGSLQKQVEKNQAPKSVDRIDRGRGPYEQDHIHFKDDHALNRDGTWKEGGRSLSNREKEWILKNGWELPEE